MVDIIQNDDELVDALLVIKDGIESKDWNKVSDGLFDITGVRVDVPNDPVSRADSIKQKFLSKVDQEAPEEPESDPDEGEVIDNDLVVKKQGELQIFSTRYNDKESKKNKKIKPVRQTPQKRNTEIHHFKKQGEGALIGCNPEPDLEALRKG